MGDMVRRSCSSAIRPVPRGCSATTCSSGTRARAAARGCCTDATLQERRCWGGRRHVRIRSAFTFDARFTIASSRADASESPAHVSYSMPSRRTQRLVQRWRLFSTRHGACRHVPLVRAPPTRMCLVLHGHGYGSPWPRVGVSAEHNGVSAEENGVSGEPHGRECRQVLLFSCVTDAPVSVLAWAWVRKLIRASG